MLRGEEPAALARSHPPEGGPLHLRVAAVAYPRRSTIPSLAPLCMCLAARPTQPPSSVCPLGARANAVGPTLPTSPTPAVQRCPGRPAVNPDAHRHQPHYQHLHQAGLPQHRCAAWRAGRAGVERTWLLVPGVYGHPLRAACVLRRALNGLLWDQGHLPDYSKPAPAPAWACCCSDYAPMVYCLDRDPSSYGGYEIALFQVG